MAQKTNVYKRTVAGSMGAGMGSLFGASGRNYYVLEHKISSKYHKVGEVQEIIVDQIELGRDAKCQVRFDESFETVSRRHVAIIRDGENWKLVQLSRTNSTYLNGRQVQKEWYLQSGDEIQLSVNGPKIGFIVPSGKKSTVNSIALSRRLSLFRQQALRPYKRVITALAVLSVLSIGSLTGWMVYKDKMHKQDLVRIEAETQTKIDSINRQGDRQREELVNRMEQQKKTLDDQTQKIKEMQKRITETTVPESVGVLMSDNEAINACDPYIYFIVLEKIIVTLPTTGEVVEIQGPGAFGTGFLLDNGRFVTARHVVEPWFYLAGSDKIDEDMLICNVIACNGGKVTGQFRAFNSRGEKLAFSGDKFRCSRGKDYSKVLDNGNRIKLAEINDTDWAYVPVSGKKEGLSYDSDKARTMERGASLKILGFPFALGADSPDNIRPQLGNAVTTGKGLSKEGIIYVTNSNFEQGNSGGPVFYTTPSGDLSVVGIVSAMAGRSTGFIVPISAVQ